MPTYRAFGLTLATNRSVPSLVPENTRAPVHTHISLGVTPDVPAGDRAGEEWYVAPNVDGEPALRVWRTGEGAYLRLRYADGPEFVVDGAGQQVWASWPASSTLEDTATYLLGPVLGLVLRLRGVTCLHASAVAIEGRAVLFAGSPSAGKSTAAAALVRLGHPALADDVAALVVRDGITHVVPAYPHLRLWPESVALLFGSGDVLPPLTPTWDKRGLDVTDAFHGEPLPLAAIYVLEARSLDGSTRIAPIDGRQRLLTLIAHGYVNYLLDRARRQQDFDALSRIAFEVPVRRLSVPDFAAHAAAFRRAIIEDSERTACTPLANMAR